MLLNFGIISRLSEKKVKNYPNNTYWRIILPKKYTEHFFDIFKPVKYTNYKIKKTVFKRTYNLKAIGNNQHIKDVYYEDTIKLKKENNIPTYVYDFNMSSDKYYMNAHQFWSNGFVSHNTTLAMNIIQRLVKQGIKPYYIYNETGSRFARISLHLGMKDGDFYHVFASDPEKIILEDDAITIFDWVKPTNYARVDNLFDGMVNRLHKTKGFMICFVQLRGDDTFFAPDQIGQFPALLCRYMYEKNSKGDFTYFHLDSIRDTKIKSIKELDIPCIYNWDTKEVKLIEEFDEKEQEQLRKQIEKEKSK